LKGLFRTGGYVYSTVAVGLDGTVYVTSADSYLYAITFPGNVKYRTTIIFYTEFSFGLFEHVIFFYL